MASSLRRGGALRVLAVLWTAVQCGGSQHQSSVDLNITPDQLLTFIEQAVKLEIQPLITKLESRMDTLDSRLYTLDSRLYSLDSRLDSTIDALDSRVDALTVQLYSRGLQADGSAKGPGSPQPPADGQLVTANETKSQNSQLEELATRLDIQQSQLDGLVTKTDNQQSQLDGLVTKTNNHKSQLEELATKTDNRQFQLDEHVAKTNNQQSHLDELITKTDDQQSQLDTLATEMHNQSSRLDDLVDRVDGQHAPANETSTIRSRNHTAASSAPPPPRDCSDLPAGTPSGVHLLQLGLNRSHLPVSAYCDMDTDGGGWTVVQRRADIQPRRDFYRRWQAYKDGFGELDTEFWWGLDNMWRMTAPSDRRYQLRIDMGDYDGGRRHAVYQGFRVSAESDGYRLAAANYTGTAGDSLFYHVGLKFSTRDRDQDASDALHCAQKSLGAWWYRGCSYTNLNGESGSPHPNYYRGIFWQSWTGYTRFLKMVEMKVRSDKTLPGEM